MRFIVVLVLALLLGGCAGKGGGELSKAPGLDNDKRAAAKARLAKRDDKAAGELKEIFPEAGTCPIDSNGADPDTDQGRLDMALELCNMARELKANGEVDEAVKALDEAYSLLLKVEDRRDPEIEQQLDDLRILISRSLLQVHAVKDNRIRNGRSMEIPLTMNKYVQREIELLTHKEKRFFMESYRRSGRYRPMIVQKLREAGLPEELSWLPLIESGFKTRALSHARALGLWQFIPSTGYRYGLSRNTWIDERLDPEKSTKAAIAYLTELHSMFGDWQTVLAAYNCGEVRVSKAIKSQNREYLDNFWDIFEILPYETARYVPRFLATLHIINDPSKYGMELPTPEEPYTFETVFVRKQMSLKDIAKALGVEADLLAALNPELRHGVTPDSGFQLKVPVGYRETFLAKVDSIKTWKPKPTFYKYYVRHRVRRGETLSKIARRYRSSVRAIMRANRLRSANRIRVGQVLKIPSSRKVTGYGTASRSKRQVKYVVKKGDTLWKIAQKYKVSVSKLRRVNRLRSNCLYVGQVLKIPRAG